MGSVYIPKSSLPINRPIKSWHAVDFTDSKLSVKTKATNSHAELSIEVIFIESGLFDHEESSLQQRQQQDGGILQRQQQQHEGSNTQVVAVSPANMMLSSMAILSEESPLNAPTSASDVAQPMSSVPLEISNSTSITTAPPLSQPTSPFKSQSPILLPSTTHAITVYTFNNVLNRQDTFTDVLEFMESTQRGNYIEFLILIKQIGSGLAAKDSTYADLSSLKEDMFNMYRTYLDFEDEAIVSVVHDSDDDDVNDDGTVLRAFIKHQPLVLKELKAMVTICSSSHDDASTELSHHPPPAFSFEEWVSLIKRLESSLVEIMQKLFWTEFCASSYFKTCLIKLQFEKTTTGSSLSKSEAASRISAANLAIPVQNVQTIISSATAREHPATENAIEIISSSVVTSNENTILSAQLPTFNDSATTNNLTKLDEGEELSVISTMENDLESEIVSELIPLALSPDHAVVTTFRKSISGDGRRSRPSSIEEVKNDLPKRPASSSPVRSASSSSTSSSATLTSPTKKDKTQTSPSKKKFFAMFKSKPTAREKVNALTDVFNDDDDEDADHGPWGGSFSNSISSFSNSASTSGENRNENPSAEAAPSMAYMSQEQLNQDEILSYVKGKSTLSPSSPTFKAAVGSASVSGMDSTTSLSSSPSSTTGTVLKDLVGSAESLGSPLISQHDLSANPWSASHSPTTDSDLSNSNFITTPYSIPASSSSSPSKSSTLTLDHTLEMKETMMIQQQQLDNVQNTGGSGMTFLAASIVNLKEQIMILDEQIEALGIGKNKKQVKALIEKKLSLQAQVEQLSEAIADLDARGNGGYIGSQRNSVSISDGTSASAPPFSAEDSSYVNLHKLTVHITDISDEAPVPSETSSSGGGLFKKHELQYIIELQRIDGSMGWIKTRKYTEFQDLNESVCSIFPKVQKMLFPARPRNIHSESGVKTRDKLSVDLTKWLVVLLSDGAICESPPLQEFLRPSSVAAPQGVSASSSTNTTASNVSRSVLGVFKSAGTVMKKVAVGSTKGVVGIVTGVADGLDAAAEVTGLKNAFRGVSDESLKVKDGEENDQIDIDSGDLTRINQKESGRRSQSSTSSSTSPQLPKKEANKHLASMIDSYDVPSIPVRNSSLTSPEGQDLASINGGEGGGTHAIGASRRPSAAEGLLHPSLSCSSTAASSRRNSEAQPEQRPSISKSPERRGGRGSDIHNPQQKSSSGNKKISTSTSNSSSSVSAAELDRDTEIILEGLFGVVEEVFNLNDPNQWIRQKGLQVMKTVLRKAYGPILMNLLRQKSEEYRDQDAVASYICRVTDMFWPGGKWPSSADKASSIAVRSVAEMEETKAKAKQIFISGGVIPVDGLAKLVGRYNCNVGLVKLFNMLQHKDLNRQLVCSMLESIVIGSITDME